MQQFEMELTNVVARAFFGKGTSSLSRPIVRTKPEAFFTFQDLADRWRCSRGTVRNRLRAAGATVLDFGGGRSKKTVAASVVYQIERKRTKRL